MAKVSQPLAREVVYAAASLREAMAGTSLLPSLAKLYSQHTRLRYGRTGLTAWRATEARERLVDASRLIEAAFTERQAGADGRWRFSMVRAAELLEWLAHPQLNSESLPLHLLAAAAYQVAGYPARSTSLLANPSLTNESEIVRAFLRADFVGVQELVRHYWQDIEGNRLPTDSSVGNADNGDRSPNQAIVTETIRSLSVIAADLRWGGEHRVSRAIAKLRGVAGILSLGRDPYSWLLARLTGEVADSFRSTSLRSQINRLIPSVSASGQAVLERYLRLSFRSGRALAWPSQTRGFELLVAGDSFALCTPTGSGKTTVAEVAILTALYHSSTTQGTDGQTTDVNAVGTAGRIAIYLVPSRALAAEVEQKLARVVRGAALEDIVVTGLYGGTDWGPTDAWLTSEGRAIVICTYEKGEALVRFLGPLFISRICLLVIDEAHQVAFSGSIAGLRSGESRALKLESLGARLFEYLERNRARVVALSAMASGVEDALARWVSGRPESSAITTQYRSTRQLVGRLWCLPSRYCEIQYDALDGKSLNLTGDGYEQPFVPRPFPPVPATPGWDSEGPEKRLRPFLLWAALQLAAPDETGQRRSVLISVAERVGGYAQDFIDILNSEWAHVELPQYFTPPDDTLNTMLWSRCLDSCADYFGMHSREYRLLQKGIAVHHGKMPGLLARLVVEVIEARIVRVVLATSTLSEGVNLPFETVLIPSLKRWGGDSLTPREFGNLVGRAGRPGISTEGVSLVLAASPAMARDRKERWIIARNSTDYATLVNSLLPGAQTIPESRMSPLAELLRDIYEVWQGFAHGTAEEFLIWLEECAPLTDTPGASSPVSRALEGVDSLDGILLSAIVELEELGTQAATTPPLELEERLKGIWRRTFAAQVAASETLLEVAFVRRGRALVDRVYTEPSLRRQLYRTSLRPTSGNALLRMYPELRTHWRSASEFPLWDAGRRLDFIERTAILISTINVFQVRARIGSSHNAWNDALRWWLHPDGASRSPRPEQMSTWHDFVNKEFTYKLNWGIGSCIAVAIEEAQHAELRPTTLAEWPQTGLPWVVFWLKELLSWGTLEPVAALLLSRRMAFTRRSATELANTYYDWRRVTGGESDLLDASVIRRWANTLVIDNLPRPSGSPLSRISVQLLRDFRGAAHRVFRVLPVESPPNLVWVDVAGHRLAVSDLSASPGLDNESDFLLRVDQEAVEVSPYI